MFAILDSFSFQNFYNFQLFFYGKVFFYFCGVLLFLEFLRKQISEINLLQLVPGFYFFLFFLLIFFLLFVSNLLFYFPQQLDNYKGCGTKTKSKMDFNLLFKFSFFLISTFLTLLLSSLIPLSLDCFNSSGEKTLETTWSLTEVILLEVILITLLILISQIPLFFAISLNSLNSLNLLTKYWKNFIFFFTILAGFLTPTLDGYTQVCFAGFTFFFYLLIVNFLLKRFLFKFSIFLNFG